MHQTLFIAYIYISSTERIKYMMALDPSEGLLHSVHRSSLFDNVVKIYREKSILCEFPIHMEFEGEMAVDQGGVTRDMYSGFWEECYSKIFDGSTLLVPMISPQMDTAVLPIVGSIMSHGYLASGFLPVRIALPCLISILCGPGASIPQPMLCEAFLDYISAIERDIFKDALSMCSGTFSCEVQEKLLGTLSRFGCRQMPTPSNLKTCLIQVAQFEFCSKPAAAVSLMHLGIPPNHANFWQRSSVVGISSIYRTLAVSSRKVLDIIKLPDSLNVAEERVSGYLVEMIGNMSSSHVQKFLRFTTGSSVLIAKCLEIHFNRLSGFSRRPIAHTCDCMLELPVCYTNYSDFHAEWMAILNDPELCWFMDSI